MTINYTDITDTQKLEVADLLLKIEALDAELADIQTERATGEIAYVAREQKFEAEKNAVVELLRKMRTATIV